MGFSRKSLAVLITLLVFLCPALALAESESGTVGLTGTVSASAPNEAPKITKPIDKTHFEESPVSVSGTCQNDLLIQVFVNDVFSGSAICANSKFSMEVDLVSGTNEIYARATDDLDQASPDSNIVTVYLDIASSNLKLTSDFARRDTNPREELAWPLKISGGSAPYAIGIDWGDGRTNLKSILVSGEFTVDHTFLYSGIYKVVVRAVDSKDNRAVLQLVAIGKGTATDPSLGTSEKTIKKAVLWEPLTVFILFMILTFWLGARYERRRKE